MSNLDLASRLDLAHPGRKRLNFRLENELDPFLLPWLALPQSSLDSLKIKERIGEDVNLARGHIGFQRISYINANIDTHY